jgi:hypothetical protein
MGPILNAITQQNQILKDTLSSSKPEGKNTTSIHVVGNVSERQAEYQEQMYQSLKTVNIYILFFYYFFFILIHVLLLEQFFRGVKRDDVVDAIMFTGFFLYPLVIYYVEAYAYFAVTYVLSFLYGNTYVNNFDMALLHTDFYTEPSASSTGETLPNIAVDIGAY